MNNSVISHKEFVNRYKKGELFVYVNKLKAGDFVLSEYADKHNKPAHLFWSWVGIILVIPLPIVFLFVNWKYTILYFVVGLIVVNSAKKTSEKFILENMLSDGNFWDYVLLHGGTMITDNKGNKIKSEFLERMGKISKKENEMQKM